MWTYFKGIVSEQDPNPTQIKYSFCSLFLSSSSPNMEQELKTSPNNNPTSETNQRAVTLPHKKHLAMLDRLSAHPSPSSSSSKPEPESRSESVPSFLSLFSSLKLSIESDLSRLLSSDPKPADPQSDLNRISASISDLERILAQNSYFLPSYELRSSLSSISHLKQTLERCTGQLLPRKKFSFKKKSKPSTKLDPAELINNYEPISTLDTKLGLIKNSPGLRSKKGATLVKNFRVLDEEKGEFTLSDLDSCEIYLKGKIRALFVNKIRNCRVHCGPVIGSILIEDVSGCLFNLASHQIRIHEVRQCDFYLRVRSRPIVEDCSGVRFGPYRFGYEGMEEELEGCGLGDETGNWANVDDFKWLRAVQSPNWCLVPEEERVEMVNASEMEENCDDR